MIWPIFISLLLFLSLVLFVIKVIENLRDILEVFFKISLWVIVCFFTPTATLFLLISITEKIFKIQLSIDANIIVYPLTFVGFTLTFFYNRIYSKVELFFEKRKRRKEDRKREERYLYLEKIQSMSIPKGLISTNKSSNTDKSNHYVEDIYNNDWDEDDEWDFDDDDEGNYDEDGNYIFTEDDYQTTLEYEAHLEKLHELAKSKEKHYKPSETYYLHSYFPKASGKEDFQSDRILNFKNGVADDVKYYCDESKKKFLSNRQKYDIIIRALGSNEISVANGSKPLDKLCIEISKVTNAQYRPEVVSKTRTTRPLKVQNLEERKNEIKNVYKLNTHENLNHKKILIVDDIRTSGTTISEITKTIKNKYPNSIIDSFCLAQTM